MAEGIDINSLIFGDDDKLNKIIDTLERLDDTFTVMVEHSSKRAKEYADNLNSIQEAAAKLEKGFTSLDISAKKDQDVLAKGAAELEELTVENDQYSVSLKHTEDQIKLLIDQQKKLEDSNRKLKDTIVAETGSLNDLKLKLKEAETQARSLGDATSAVVKEEAIKKVRDLSKAVNQGEEAIRQAKKGVDVAAGSYNNLTAQVNKAKKDLKAMEGGIGSSSKEFLKLQKFVHDGTAELKKFDAAVGDNQRNVGDYARGLDGLDNALGGVGAKVRAVFESLKLLGGSAIVAVIAILAAAFIALRNAVSTYYEDSIKGEDDLAKARLRNEELTDNVKESWAEVGETVSSAWESIKEATIAAFFAGDVKDLIKSEKEIKRIAGEFSALQKEHIRDIVDDSAIELRVNVLLEKSKDKLREKDEDRLAAAKAAKVELQNQLKDDIVLAERDLQAQKDYINTVLHGRLPAGKSLADLTDEEFKQLGVTYDQVKKLQDLEVALNKVKSDAILKEIAFNKIENSVSEEIARDKKAREEALRKAHKERIEEQMKLNEADAKDFYKKLDEQIEASKRSAITDYEIAKKLLDDKIVLIKEEAEDTVEGKRKAEEQILRLQRELADEYIQIQIDRVSRILAIENLSVKDRAALEVELSKLRLDLADAIFSQLGTDEAELLERTEKTLANITTLYNDFASAVSGIFAGITERRLQAIDREEKAFEDQVEKQLELAGDNEEAKKQIEKAAEDRREAIAKKRREAQAREAILEKVLAVFQAGLEEAKLIIKALSGNPLAIAAAIAGGLQVAAIAAMPIPEFYRGVMSSPEGPAIVAERGREIVADPKVGKAILYDTPGPALTYLSKGSRVFSNEETEKILEAQEFNKNMSRAFTSEGLVDRVIERTSLDLRPVIEAIDRNTPPDIIKAGDDIFEVKRARDGSKKIIRSKSLSS